MRRPFNNVISGGDLLIISGGLGIFVVDGESGIKMPMYLGEPV